MHKVIFLLVVCVCGLSGLAFGLGETETNNDRSEANGPFSFPDTITGNLQNDGGGIVDYFEFSATAGNSYQFYGTITGGALGADLGLDIENSSSILATADANGDGQPETLNWSAPSSGTFYLVVYEATNTPNGISSYNVSASITSTGPDIAAPTWPGGTAGVNTVTRLAGNTSAEVTWFQASDDVTAQNEILYNIYYSTTQGTVFSGGVKTTQTGTLSKQISGLLPDATYFFGVRAKDATGNTDNNTRTVQNDPLPSAAGASWALYE
jgi:hypothetical protein